MKLIIFLLFAIVVLPYLSFCQTSFLQDKSGESSISLQGNKSIQFNSSDASFSTNISFAKVPAGRIERFWGFNLRLKSNDGISKLLEGYDFKPKYDFSLYKGIFLKS